MSDLLRKSLRWLMIALALCFAVFALYLLWLLLTHYWAPVIFVTYILIGVAVGTTALIGFLLAQQKLAPDSLIFTIAIANTTSRVARLRNLLGVFLTCLVLATGGWIPLVYHAARQRGSTALKNIAGMALTGLDQRIAPLTLLFVLIAYFAFWLQAAQVFWIKLFLLVQLFHVVTRHLAYAVAPLSLPTRLRRQIGNAYVSFVVIAVSDVATLVLILSSILHWNTFTLPDQGSLFEAFKGIFFGNSTELAKKVWEGKGIAPIEALMAMIGALLSLNFIETALKFREFRRSDDDNIAVANSYVAFGRYVDAIGALDLVKSRNAAYFSCRALADMGVLRIDNAWNEIEQAITLRRTPQNYNAKKPVSPNEVFLQLAGASGLMRVPPSSLRALIDRAIASGTSDICLATGMMSIFGFQAFTDRSGSALADLSKHVRLPLMNAVISTETGNLDQARLLLDGARPNGLFERFLCSHQLVFIEARDHTTTQAQVVATFSAQGAQFLQEFSGLDWKTVEPWDQFVMFVLSLRSYKLAQLCEPTLMESWQQVMNEIRKSMPTDAIDPRSLDNLQRALQQAS